MLSEVGMCGESRARTQIWYTKDRHTHTISPAQRDILNYKGRVALCGYQGVVVGDYFSVREWVCLKAEN